METANDITYAFTKPKLTKENTITPAQTAHDKTEHAESPAQTRPETPVDKNIDHPVIKFVDFAVNAAVPICNNAGLTPPDTGTYNNFARDAVNKAAWDYLPVADGEDTPKWLGLLIALGALAAVFAPTALSAIEKAREKEELGAAKAQALLAQNETAAQYTTPDQTQSPAMNAPSPQATAENSPKIHFDTDPGYTPELETINPTT